tara:strand:- start:6444 stop:7298 length:855 start_codon:yes stop_codon:yes gene_type:complete
MQRYKILHRTYYNFSSAVSLGLHSMRLRPREDHELRIESLNLKISPEPDLRWHRDVEGNSVAIASFSGTTRQLAIESELIIQQYLENPLDFLVAEYAINYPFQYSKDDEVLLSPYMAEPGEAPVAGLADWIASIWRQGEPIQTYSLLQRLTTHIYQNMIYLVREEPGVQSADHTLNSGTGSCRDFALLFMAASRELGLAARFVTGYLHAPTADGAGGATHAWAEVYLPGAGWRGFDPTSGVIVGADHIPVAVARLPESVPPVAGMFRGSASSQLEVGVWVSKYP